MNKFLVIGLTCFVLYVTISMLSAMLAQYAMVSDIIVNLVSILH